MKHTVIAVDLAKLNPCAMKRLRAQENNFMRSNARICGAAAGNDLGLRPSR
jgi:hypothetical protein